MISICPFQSIVLLRVTPSANRNSDRVATPYYIYTQGSVLRPQPWAGESQLLQSCRCLCKPLPEPSPRGGSSTSSPIPTLLKPLPGPPPRGGRPFLLCFRWLGGTPSPWGGLGRGFSALATPTELPLLVEASLRTLTRSGRATISPILTISTKRKERSLTALNTARMNSFPLGKVGMGPLFDALPLGRGFWRVGVGLSFY